MNVCLVEQGKNRATWEFIQKVGKTLKVSPAILFDSNATTDYAPSSSWITDEEKSDMGVIADKLHKALVEAGNKGLTGSEQREVFGHHVKQTTVVAARNLLAERKIAVTIKERTYPKGAPTIHTYLIKDVND